MPVTAGKTKVMDTSGLANAPGPPGTFQRRLAQTLKSGRHRIPSSPPPAQRDQGQRGRGWCSRPGAGTPSGVPLWIISPPANTWDAGPGGKGKGSAESGVKLR